MPVPVPRIRAVTLVLAFVAGFLLARRERDGVVRRRRSTRRPTIPTGNAVQRFDRGADGSLTPAGTFATGGARARRARRAPGRRRAHGRRPLPVRGQRRLRQRLGLPHRPAAHPARRHRRLAAASRRPASTSTDGRVYVLNSRRHAERHRVLALADGSLKADRDARARAGRRGRRAGLRHARRPLARRQRAARQPARDAAARRASAAPARRSSPPRAAPSRSASASPRRARSSCPRRARAPSRPTAPARGGALRTVTASLRRRPGRRVLGRRLAERPLRLHRQRGRRHQRLRDRPRRVAERARHADPRWSSPRDLDFDASGRYLHADQLDRPGHDLPRRLRRVADARRHRAGRRRHHRRRGAVTNRGGHATNVA